MSKSIIVFYLLINLGFSTAAIGLSDTNQNAVAFIQNGKAVGTIVLPSSPTKTEIFAAEEIQIYLHKITGVQVPIVKVQQVPKGPAIVIGNHPANKAVIQTLKAKYPIVPGSWKTAKFIDAFALVCGGETLHIAGQSDMATLYAAWDWLESLGVRWIMPGEFGTFVPSIKDVRLTPVDKLEAPAMAYRGPGYSVTNELPSTNKVEHGVPASYLFTYRLRMNNNTGFEPQNVWIGIGSGHSYFRYLPPEKYFKNNPEWYHQINGKRHAGPGWQLCFTNSESAKEFAKNVLVDIANSLKKGYCIERMRIYVTPNDARAWCECPECQKLADSDGSATSMVTNYANLVAKEIRKTYPNARIVFYAYDNYARPGDHVKPGPGVCAELTFWTANTAVGANHAQPMFSDANDKFRRYFKQWSGLCDEVSAHTYYGHYNWMTPMPYVTQIAKDLPEMTRYSNFYGMYSEMHLHWGTQGPQFYLYPRLMWNPNLDVAAVMNDYYDKGFGPASPYIKSYFQLLQKKLDSLPYICGYLVEIPKLLTPDIVAQCNDCMDKAEKTLEQMDEGARWRTRLVINAWRNSAKVATAMRLYVNSTKSSDRTTILKLLSEVLAFMDTPQGRWAFESPLARAALTQIYEPLTLPLGQLPAGHHKYRFSLEYGGAIKFFGKVKGFIPGIWGYSLSPQGQGQIDLPLQSVKGHNITEMVVRLGFGDKENVQVILSAEANGQRRVLAEGLADCCTSISIPSDMLGEKITLSIQIKNEAAKPQIILTNLSINSIIQ